MLKSYYGFVMVILSGAPVLPAKTFKLAEAPESIEVILPDGIWKYTIILSPGLSAIGALACNKHNVGSGPASSKSISSVVASGNAVVRLYQLLINSYNSHFLL